MKDRVQRRCSEIQSWGPNCTRRAPTTVPFVLGRKPIGLSLALLGQRAGKPERPKANAAAKIPVAPGHEACHGMIASAGTLMTIIAHFSEVVKLVVHTGTVWLTKQHNSAIVYYIAERVRRSGLAQWAVLSIGDSSPSAMKRGRHPEGHPRGDPGPSSDQGVSCLWRGRPSTSGEAEEGPAGSPVGLSLTPQLENVLSRRSEIDL